MKVLIATFTFLPNADGVAEAGATMARGFAERGHEVIVATEYCARRTNFEPIPGVRVEQFRISGNPNLRVGIRGDVDAYRKFLLETDPDYLICHCWDCWPTWLAQAIFDKLRARKILVSHGCSSQIWQRQRAFPWGLGQWLGWQHLTLRLPFIMRSYDHVVFLSEQRDLGRFFDHLLADLTGFRRHSVIPNAVNLSLFAPQPTDFRQAYELGDTPVFLCVANYSERKNQDLAIRAFHKIQTPASLVFVGSEYNAYSDRMLETISTLGRQHKFPGKILLLEKFSREQVVQAFLSSDIVLLTALAETQPIVLLEAMASGKPFLSTDTGCVRSMPGGLTARSESELIREMQRLATEPSLRRQLGASGRQAAEDVYATGKVIEAYFTLLSRYPPRKDLAC